MSYIIGLTGMKLLKSYPYRFYQPVTVLAIILIIAISVYTVYTGREYFSRNGVRLLAFQINEYGYLAPLVISGLILASTLLPPLPIPIPLIEIVAGAVFGFWPGFVLVFISQLISSSAAYFASKFFFRIIPKKIIMSRFFRFYVTLVKKKQELSIVVIRATMIAPFNISYLAGYLKVPFIRFILATAVGVSTEAAVFPYLGTLIARNNRFRLLYVFIILIILSIMPTLVFLITSLIPPRAKRLIMRKKT